MESTSKEVDVEAKGIDNAEKQWSNGLWKIKANRIEKGVRIGEPIQEETDPLRFKWIKEHLICVKVKI